MTTARVTGFDHVQLAMPEGQEDQAATFYEGLLGLPRRPKPEPLASRGGCWFANDHIALHLGVQADFRPATKAHPALVVTGLADLVATLEAESYEVTPDDTLAGPLRCYVHDPFGNRIELIDAG